MNRQGFLIGFLVGGWIATLLVMVLPHLGLGPARLALAEDPPSGTPAQPFGPNGPQLPGPTVNPLGETTARGISTPAVNTSDSNNRAIALSASIGSGQSVVYYFDTVERRLCVYQYVDNGSSRSGLRLLAARYIDYDLKLETYRDLSEKTPGEMREMWERSMGQAGADRPGGGALPTKQVNLPGGIR